MGWIRACREHGLWCLSTWCRPSTFFTAMTTCTYHVCIVSWRNTFQESLWKRQAEGKGSKPVHVSQNLQLSSCNQASTWLISREHATVRASRSYANRNSVKIPSIVAWDWAKEAECVHRRNVFIRFKLLKILSNFFKRVHRSESRWHSVVPSTLEIRKLQLRNQELFWPPRDDC